MSRVSTNPRLGSIDEAELQRDVKAALDECQKQIGLASNIADRIGELLLYARTGEFNGEREAVPVLLVGVAMSVSPWSAMLKREVKPDDVSFCGPLALKEPATSLGVVLAAALARYQLGQKQPVTPRLLGALCNGGRNFVHNAIMREELSLKAGRIPATQAKRWAKARGVVGL